jgi:hypothetical protein
MRRSIRLAAWSLLIFVSVTALSLTSTPNGPLASPYVSGLDVAGGPSITPVSCNNTSCSRQGTCVHQVHISCFLIDIGVCQNSSC